MNVNMDVDKLTKEEITFLITHLNEKCVRYKFALDVLLTADMGTGDVAHAKEYERQVKEIVKTALFE